jgi:hypothetical protein
MIPVGDFNINVNRPVLWACIIAPALGVPIGPFSFGVPVIVFLVVAAWIVFKNGIKFPPKAILACIAGFAAYSYVQYAYSPCQNLLAKSLISFGLMTVLLLAMHLVASSSRLGGNLRDMRWIIALVCVSIVIDAVWLKVAYPHIGFRPGGVFREPSHLGLAVSPLLAALAFSSNRVDRLYVLLATALICYVSGSATLFFMIALCLGVSLLAYMRNAKIHQLIFCLLSVLVLVAIGIYVTPYRVEFISRVSGLFHVTSRSNASSLVYIYGWEVAWKNFVGTHWLGLGFNRMGCVPIPAVDVDWFLKINDIVGVNYNDGSFTVSKLISEMGILSIPLFCCGLFWFVRMLLDFDKVKDEFKVDYLLGINVVAVMLFGGFVRGNGYFFGSFVFGLFYLILFVVRRASAFQVLSR